MGTRRLSLTRKDPRARPCHLGQRRRTNQREDRSSLSRKIKEKVNGVTVQHKNSSHDHNAHLNLQFISFRLYMESIQFIFWLYMENVCVYHVSSSCLRVSAAFSLTIVLFVEEPCALRLTCASSLRFNQGFCME